MTKWPTAPSLVCLARLDEAEGIRSAMAPCEYWRVQEASWEWEEEKPEGL